MRRTTTFLLMLLFTIGMVNAQDVILITDDAADDAQYAFLMRNGFNVTKFDPGSSLAAAGQDTIDMLNAADLVIVGRSMNSGQFDGDDQPVWNALTVPLIVNSQWIARSHRIGMFNSRSAYHLNELPNMAYGVALVPGDPIFSGISLEGDSMAWCLPPHDFLQNNDSATNGTFVVMYDKTNPLVARWDAGTPYYEGSVGTPSGPRVYFGMGNDDLVNLGLEVVPNNFPLSKAAKQVYLNEITRLTGVAAKTAVFGTEDTRIILVTDNDEGDDDQDDMQFNWLVNQGFYASKFDPGDALSAAGQDTIDKLNAADLIIVGRSMNSGQFDGDDQPVWNALTAPLIVNSQWVARSHRIGMFNSRSAYHMNDSPAMVYGMVSAPADPIFADVSLMGDSLGWCVPPHDFLENADSANNGDIIVKWGTNPLVTRWDAGTPYYEGSVGTPAGPRVYWGMGNDDLLSQGIDPAANNFPLTKDAKQVYLAEICRLAGIDAAQVPMAKFTAADANIIFISDDEEDDAQINWLKKNGMHVTKFYEGGSLAAAGQDTIDMLNAAELIIVGRSPGSGNFDGDDQPVWNALTAPLIMNSQWGARSHRLGMFNSRSAYHQNEAPDVAYATTDMPDDVVFSNVTLGDSLAWCLPPHDFIENNDSATNGTIIAMYNMTSPLLARWDAGTPYYEGSVGTPSGPRAYFGIGNDDVYKSNFFPLTDDAQQVYYNEISRILGAELSTVLTVSSNAYLDSLMHDVAEATMTPEFNMDSVDYMIQMPAGSDVITLMAYAADEMSTVMGDSALDVSMGDTLTTEVVVMAENGAKMFYVVTVYPDASGTDIKEAEVAEGSLSLYPNPVTSVMYIESEQTINELAVFNVTGKLVLSKQGLNSHREQLDMSNLNSGIYLIRVNSGTESTMTKFLKK